MFDFKTEKDKSDFFYALEKMNQGYNPLVKMHKTPFSSPGYHTTLTGGDVHQTRGSLIYVVAGAGYGKTQAVRQYIEQQPDAIVR